MADETLLVQTMAEMLGISEHEVRDASYGVTREWDSVAHLTLISAIEERLGIELDAVDVSAMSDYRAIRGVLSDRYGLVLDD